MILRDLPILADENISTKVVLELRGFGLDVATTNTLWSQGVEVQPPFVMVATRTGDSVVIRVRHTLM